MSTVADVITRIRAQLSDSGAAPRRWSEAELIDYINDGLRKSVTLKPEANVIEYLHRPPNEAALQKLPADAVKFIKVVGNSPHQGYDPVVTEEGLAVYGDLMAGDLVQVLFDVTSRIYPIEAEERLTGAGVPLSGYMNGEYFDDNLVSLGAILSGTLRTVLLDYDMAPEALDSSGAILSGTLRTVLLDYDMAPEALDSSGAILSGAMRVALVRYEDWPVQADSESLLSSGTIISGSLT